MPLKCRPGRAALSQEVGVGGAVSACFAGAGHWASRLVRVPGIGGGGGETEGKRKAPTVKPASASCPCR
eukprot:3623924-Alexandrium_andersonii.AAC.1